MSIFSAFKHLIPEMHAFSDEEKAYNLGATWTAQDGLKDYHNLRVQYIRNSERLALQGDPQPDGSWRYTEPNGSVHVITAERAQHFMSQTQMNANIMCEMLDKLQKQNYNSPIVDTDATAA